MQFKIKMTFILELDNEELRLVTAALHGNLSDEQQGPALELQEKILTLKVQQLDNFLKNNEVHLKNIEESKKKR